MNQPNHRPQANRNAYVNFLGPVTFNPPLVFEDASVAVAGHVIVDTWGTPALRQMICVFAVPQVDDLLDALTHRQDVIERAWSPAPYGTPGIAALNTAPPRVQDAYQRAMPPDIDTILRDGRTFLATGKPVTA